MTPDATASTDPAGLSSLDLLHMAQNPKTPVEVLEQILEQTVLSPEILMAILRHPQTPGPAMADLAERAEGPLLDILLGALDRVGRWIEALEALLRNPRVPEAKHTTIRSHIETAKKRDPEGSKKNLLLRIKDLPVGQKLTLAKKGNKDVRMILIKDPNEMVALEVVASPRITEGEILAAAMMRDISDKVLRYIASNRKYRQHQQVVVALVNNPRTPVGVSLGLGLHQLSDRELNELSKNRNVPGAVSRAAKSILDRRKGVTTPQAGGH
jgi:hypothetical protein